VPAPRVVVAEPPEGMAVLDPPPPQVAIFRRRETGTYGEAPYVEEWKPLPPRLHDFVHVERPAGEGRFAIAVRPLGTGLTLDEARARAASLGARLPTEDEWQAAALAGVLERPAPHVWEWTESEHRDGRTRFAILKGGSDFVAEGSDWYVDGGDLRPQRSLKLLLVGGGLQRSPWIGFRLAVDLA
jgi:formylglycine-generating enzyme required for sulfatase activity